MSWTKELQHVGRKGEIPQGKGSYKGFPIYASPLTHERVAAEVINFLPNKEAKILILGAGSGAFDERLYDLGYKNIIACEFDKDVYKGRFPLISQDLNNDFNTVGIFDCVIALELVEHLENHFHFLRNCKEILSDDGILIISTPNAESSLSRSKFFLRGDMQFFSQYEMLSTGHINPVFSKIFVYYAEKISLKCELITGNASVWSLSQYGTLAQKFFVFFLYFVSLIQKNKDKWLVSIYIFKNKK